MGKYIGEGIARELGRARGLNEEDTEVVAYGLEYLFSVLLGISLTLTIAFFLGILVETATVLLCWWLVRRSAGGAHSSTLWRCAAGSSIGALATVYLSRDAATLMSVSLWTGLALAWTLWATWKWAPNNRKKPVRDPAKRKMLRRRALGTELLLGLGLLLFSFSGNELLQTISAAGGGGIASSALLLSPPGFWLADYFDKICTFCLSHNERRETT